MQQRALDTSRKVKVRCVHGEVADYPLVPISVKFRGKQPGKTAPRPGTGGGGMWRGGMGRRNALMGERVLRRVVKRRASEWWLTPVSNSSDCRTDKRKGPRSPGDEGESIHEHERNLFKRSSHRQQKATDPAVLWFLCFTFLLVGTIKTPLARHPWLPRLPSLQPWTLLHRHLKKKSYQATSETETSSEASYMG